MSTLIPFRDPRYPIGPFVPPDEHTLETRDRAIAAIAATPGEVRAATEELDEEQLDTCYRDGGWTVRQVVHHLADSHMNAYIRLRLALTETNPLVRPYDEAAWAELSDARLGPVTASLELLGALHLRWTTLLLSLAPTAFGRPMTHPANGVVTIDWQTSHYAWHGQHHLGHIRALRVREGWC